MKTQIRYQDAIPEMPDGFVRRMEQTLEGIEEPMKRRYKLTSALVAAIIILLLLAGAAFAAARSGLLERLFPSGAPQRALDLLVTDAAVDEKEGIRLSIDEYMFDGRTLHFNWTVSSEREEGVYYLTDYRIDDDLSEEQREVGGSYGGNGSGEVGDNHLVALGVSADGRTTPRVYSGEAGMGYGEIMPTSPVTLTVTVTAFTTDLSPVMVNDEQDPLYMLAEDDPVLRKLTENRQIGISWGIGSIKAYPEFAAAREALLAAGTDWDRANVEAHAASGLMKPLMQLSASVVIDPAAAPTVGRAQLSGARDFDLVTHELRLLEVSFEPGATLISYDIYPKSGVFSETPIAGERLLIVDEQGQVLDLTLSIGLDASRETDADGREYLHVERDGSPAAEPPKELRLVLLTQALMQEAKAHTSSPAEAYRYAVDHADPAQVAVISLAD